MDIDQLLKYDQLGRSHWWLTSKYTVISDMLKGLYPGRPADRILDIGCASGVFIDYLKQFRCRIFGVDLNHEILRVLIRRDQEIAVAVADANKLPFLDNAFDLVSLIDVLEHVADDRQLVQRIKNILKPRGLFVLCVPAYGTLYGRHDRLYGHKRRYRRTELANLLRDEGFLIQRATYLQPAFVVPLWLKRKFCQNAEGHDDFVATPRWVNAILHNILCLEKYLLRKFDFPFGATLVCFCCKT